MHEQLLHSIVDEIRSQAGGNFIGRILQLTPLSYAIDIGIRQHFLFISADPASPRFYLIQRRLKELEKQATGLSYFAQQLKSQLSGARLIACEKDAAERVVRLTFRAEDELGTISFRRLVVQLTGRAANVFLLDELNRITAALRQSKNPGQTVGAYYSIPIGQQSKVSEFITFTGSPSAAADAYYRSLDASKAFTVTLQAARNRLRQAKTRKARLRDNLQKDLADHGDPADHKRLGDLLLANLATAKRSGDKVSIIDYYSKGTPTIEVGLDEKTSIQEAAAQYFREYTKAKRARQEINKRLQIIDSEISALSAREDALKIIAENHDAEALTNFDKEGVKRPESQRPRGQQNIPGVRRYLSTDGYEILVGRAARDNDNLTFRIARPNDLWLHAGDYPGSHVVVRNPTRKEIPQRTVIEAAQLAARFSQASEDAKVVIHYTERKFLSKPKGAAAGLVRLSRFRSLTVEPKEVLPRL